MRGRKKGHVVWKKLTITPRAIRTYYWIQQYVNDNGKFPTYYDIGVYLGANPQSYYTARNIGIGLVQRWLEPNGFVVRENRVLRLTDKPLSESNIIKD